MAQTQTQTQTQTQPYRWYLCIEKRPLQWTCVRTEEKEALYPWTSFSIDTSTTKAVPIQTWVPRILDPIILHSTLHPKVGITL